MSAEVDLDSLAAIVVTRIRNAAEHGGAESPTADAARRRVVRELVALNTELKRLARPEREQVEAMAGVELRAPLSFPRVIQEASVEVLVGVGSYWSHFFGALGI